MFIIEYQSSIFSHSHKFVQALVIVCDEGFQALTVKGDALFSKPHLGVGCDYDVIWKS
jgi:hypothetical protein